MDTSENPVRSRRRKHRRWFTLIATGLLAGGVITAGCFWQQRRQRETETHNLSNMRQLGLALYDFDSDYGSFPNAETLATLNQTTGSPLSEEAVKNPLLQLQAAGITTDLENLLAAPRGAEGDWLYFPGTSTTGNPARVLMITPLIEGQRLAMRLDSTAAAPTQQQIEDAIRTANPPPIAIHPTKYF